MTRPSRIAAIPIGYADGLNRHLGNGHAYCLVNGQRAPYVGNICMDVCMIDVTDIDCKEGDSVEIFGDHLPITVLSDVLGTIPYEVLTSVSTRVKRVSIRIEKMTRRKVWNILHILYFILCISCFVLHKSSYLCDQI